MSDQHEDPDIERARYDREAVERDAKQAAAERVRAKIAAAKPGPVETLAAYLAGVGAAIPLGTRQEDVVAQLVAAGIERVLGGAPLVRRGDVAITLGWELAQMTAEWRAGKALAAKVDAALASAEAWEALRNELTAPPVPEEVP